MTSRDPKVQSHTVTSTLNISSNVHRLHSTNHL